MGRVWLARDQMLDRDVAIKEIVPPDWMSDAEKDRLHSRTLREARSAARLTHPHVVRVYDVVHAEGLSWIVMEYVASRSLYQVLTSKGPYPPAEAARIGLAVLDALTAAHDAGVLHRDVKPHNVLIGSDGRVLLTDFGLATFVDDGMITTPGLIVGSPQYVSPERARDGASTRESDLWSFGATLYATVEGQSPYARDSAMATLAALATEPPDPALRAGPLAPILEGLLRYDPGARLSAEEAERQLRRVLGEEPGGASRSAGAGPPAAEPTTENTEPLGESQAELDTPNLTDSDQSLAVALPVPYAGPAISALPVPGNADAGPGRGAAHAGAGFVTRGAQPEVAEDSDEWWRSPADGRTDDSLVRSRYIEGTFTVGALSWAGAPSAGERGASGSNRGPDRPSSPRPRSNDPGPPRPRPNDPGSPRPRPNDPGAPTPRPNRAPAAAGRPATSPSARRGNQVLLRGIPSPRPPVSGPLHPNQPPPRRWTRRPRPANHGRARLIIAGLLAAVLVGGGLLSIHLIIRENSAPPAVESPTPSAPVASSPSRGSPSPASPARTSPSLSPPSRGPSSPASPSSRGPSSPASPSAASPLTAGFSPVVCDVRPPSRVPVAPKGGAARGVNGWELQTGWSYFTDGTGFHIPVPDGWSYQRIGTTYCFRDPRGARVLSLDVARPAGTDPQEGCRAEEGRLKQPGRVRDYTPIAISPVALLHDAADWDYRYRTAAGVLRRATTRWFAAGDHAYALGWATPEATWATELSKIEMVRATFYTNTPPTSPLAG
ncbi:protein kinase [Actinoplanes sp. NPDC020271]|uniref:serine/threonine-protein kinase n=1 Tax=Actinoplanes sp. NPDC020271 TaxID=3363896 RepID=UPI0037AD7BFC